MLYGIVTAKALCVSAFLPIVCTVGDATLQRSATLWHRVLWDSTVHASVASLAWLVVSTEYITLWKLLQCAVCGFLSSVVDLDHFVAAASLSLEEAVSLENRPLLHNSTLMLGVSLFPTVICWLLLSAAQFRTPAFSCCMIFVVAWTTHHLRDGLRRGLWIAPFGHTAPLPRWLYLVSTTTVPFVVRMLMLLNTILTDRQQQTELLADRYV